MAKLHILKKFVLNRAGVRELLRSSEMQDVLREAAEAVRANAGDGYSVDVHVGKNRANASVGTESIQSRADNLRNNTLLRALGGGGTHD